MSKKVSNNKSNNENLLRIIQEQNAQLLLGVTSIKEAMLDVQAEIVEIRKEREYEGRAYLEHMDLVRKLQNKIDDVVLGLHSFTKTAKELLESKVAKGKRKS